MNIEIKRVRKIDAAIRQAVSLYLSLNKISRAYPLSQHRVEHMLRQMTEHPAYGLWVAYDGEMPVGFVSGQLQDSLFHDRIFAFDLGWFVLPGYQGQGIGRRLIDTYVDWAREHQASVAHFCVSYADEASDQRSTAMLATMGFESWGQLTRMVLDTE